MYYLHAPSVSFDKLLIQYTTFIILFIIFTTLLIKLHEYKKLKKGVGVGSDQLAFKKPRFS